MVGRRLPCSQKIQSPIASRWNPRYLVSVFPQQWLQGLHQERLRFLRITRPDTQVSRPKPRNSGQYLVFLLGLQRTNLLMHLTTEYMEIAPPNLPRDMRGKIHLISPTSSICRQFAVSYHASCLFCLTRIDGMAAGETWTLVCHAPSGLGRWGILPLRTRCPTARARLL
jgi:hypothetical protein